MTEMSRYCNWSIRNWKFGVRHLVVLQTSLAISACLSVTLFCGAPQVFDFLLPENWLIRTWEWTTSKFALDAFARMCVLDLVSTIPAVIASVVVAFVLGATRSLLGTLSSAAFPVFIVVVSRYFLGSYPWSSNFGYLLGVFLCWLASAGGIRFCNRMLLRRPTWLLAYRVAAWSTIGLLVVASGFLLDDYFRQVGYG